MAAQATKNKRNNAAFMDIGVSVFVVFILAMIIIPLPAFLLDLMLIINIALSITILLLTLFTKNVLEFSSFPTLLLITTMYRLGLNISSTRLILTVGEAGRVIDTFANLVAGNNMIVGAVIFIIIFVIQMIVVTSGSSRVSEVSARFTLDAMPGKQMSIDSDLNSGLINEEQAKKRRNDLERETQFFGAMDGASKFVKGDATASIVITLVNLIGGTLIHSIGEGMPVLEALNQFGKLTIGDGLVSQIPALLISIGSGVLVTRSGNAKSFGSTLVPELFGSPKILYMVAGILCVFAVIPGFPILPFLLLAAVLGGSGYLLQQNEESEKVARISAEQEALAQERTQRNKTREDTLTTFQVDAIAIEIGYGLIAIADDSKEHNLMNQVQVIRKQCAQEMGILLSPIRIRDNLQLQMNQYVIKIKGNVHAQGEIYLDKHMIVAPGETDFVFDGIPTKEPTFGLDAMWIHESDREMADLRGYTVVDPLTVLVTHLKESIYKHSYELLGRQEVKQLLEGLKETHNVVIDELIPDILRLGEVQKVLQNLLKEQIPITDLVTILETLADYGTTVKDAELLTEYVRQALKRTIVKAHLDDEQVLHVVTVHPNTEELLTRNIQKSSAGSIPILQGDIVTRLFDNIKKIHSPLDAQGIPHVLLVSPKNRPALKNLLTYNFPEIAVLSLNEVPNEISIESAGMVDSIEG
ncbi:type iii secretion system fhipep [Trichococcus palustris]|uniref:Flagellar biosynthesis protein FlhA n=1 Tax=Trichococcus palustris TaxID=140314 RepID=A0A143YZA3_9LACT|nr:flagellar biosynthesis protein FlhA [Trichococcus palustris]CZR02465.1 type iii secretion system fhipep [Trichococcus palustris]SFL13264.1 flagellar biosynthesis protein FlhA [Trichococcus palustris]